MKSVLLLLLRVKWGNNSVIVKWRTAWVTGVAVAITLLQCICRFVKRLKAALQPHMQVTLTSMMTEVSCLQNLQWLQAAAQASERPDQPVWCRAGSGSCSAGWSAEVPGRFCCRLLVSVEGFLGSHLQQFLVSASLSVLTAYSLGCDTH